jgi:hypothetical protein
MKKMVLMIVVMLAMGCSQKMVWIGMTEYELTSQHWRYLRVEESNSSRTVYAACNYYGYDCSYFYFRGGKMYATDRGEYRPDISVEVK